MPDSSAFDRALDAVLQVEGGYVDNPKDPGGATNMGICQRDYPDLDIKNLTRDQAAAIYRQNYWNKVSGDDLPWPLCLAVFDSAVNQGPGAAAKFLQRALGVNADGAIGPQTLKAAQGRPAPALGNDVMAHRALAYASTRNFADFGLGWMRRLFIIHQAMNQAEAG